MSRRKPTLDGLEPDIAVTGGANLRERFWLRIVAFAVRRANKAGGLHRGTTKYHWTRPAPEDTYVD